MSIVDELITDRTQADVNRVRELALKGWANLTDAEKAEWNAGMKGAYNATDLNRVTQAMDYINAELEGYGYVTGYEKVEVPHAAQPVSPLPDGYVQLEYIESTGTQYIDTGFMPNQNTRTVIDFQATVAPTNDWILGVRKSTNVDSYGTMAGSATSITSWFGTARVTQTVNALTNRFVLDKNKEETTIEYESGESTSIPNSSSEFECEYNLFLLNINLAGSAASAAISGNLYSCQVYDNGTLIRDYIPCSDPSGEVGLYDRVNGVFYGNAGTGTFGHGPVAAPPAPQNLRQTGKTLESISLAWDAVGGADGYKLYRDGALIATQAATSYTDTGLLPSESHSYQVLAYNDQGDGTLSEPVSMSTKQAYYIVTPVFTSAVFSQNPTTINTSVLLSVAVGDQIIILQPEVFQSNEIYTGEV